jgi:formate dehydrogenase major subunit
VIVVDPRDTQIARMADLYLCQRPGTDVALLNGLMHVIIEQGLYDREFVENRTEGFEELKASRRRLYAGAGGGHHRHPGRTAGRRRACTPRPVRSAILYTMGITQHTTGVDNVLSCANLAMLTGNWQAGHGGQPPARPEQRPGRLRHGRAAQRLHRLPGGDNEAVQQKFEEAWGRTSHCASG